MKYCAFGIPSADEISISKLMVLVSLDAVQPEHLDDGKYKRAI